MELELSVQKYDWGKLGSESVVAKLAQANSGIDVNENEPYAELWLGVHPNGPSRLKNKNITLAEYLSDNSEALGVEVIKTFGAELPYLFKVLSVRKALSIQAHPSKSHAEQLFMQHPDIYKDPNHKPELAIALTKFEALCGFKPYKQIEEAIKSIPELISLLGKDLAEAFLKGEKGIYHCFEALMKCPSAAVKSALATILERAYTLKEGELITRLDRSFPGDVGILCVFFLNYVVLTPGEALFLAPNEPHAYLFGDCVECMANSDNVVRAGLTPKFRDVTTLCGMLTYKSYEPDAVKFLPEKEDESCLLFRPPVKDFAVAKITLKAGATYSLKPRSSASIILALEGKSTASSQFGRIPVKAGVALFLPANKELSFSAESDQILYQALCNV